MTIFTPLLYSSKSKRDFKQKLSDFEVLEIDLGLELLYDKMSENDDFIKNAVRVILLNSLDNPADIEYRQSVIKDSIQNEQVIQNIYTIVTETKKMKQEHWLGIFGKRPGSLLSSSISMLELYFKKIKEIREVVEDSRSNFNSSGFLNFFDMLEKEFDDKYLKSVFTHLKGLRFRNGILMEATFDNINIAKGYNILQNNSKNWIEKIFKSKSYTYKLHPRDDAGANILQDMSDEALEEISLCLSDTAKSMEGFFDDLRFEMAFCLGAVNLYKKLDVTTPLVFPKVKDAQERVLNFKDLKNPILLLIGNEPITGNDLRSENIDLYLITGANRGGKTTYLKSIAIAKLLAQSGLFVPAQEFETNISVSIFTHFKKEEDDELKSGKLDEELKRLSSIIDKTEKNSTIFFNESISSTNELEGSIIAYDILKALVEKKVEVYFVTHNYSLCKKFIDKKIKNILFLRANRYDNGKRDFKVTKNLPLKTSFAKDIYLSRYL